MGVVFRLVGLARRARAYEVLDRGAKVGCVEIVTETVQHPL
jgi:predicted RecB family endonuclease